MPEASEVLREATKGLPAPLTDADIFTSCPECGDEQALSDASLETADDGLETTYTCKNGCGPILIVSTPGVIEWKGRGYRFGDWAIRNPGDLDVKPPMLPAAIHFPASPAALD